MDLLIRQIGKKFIETKPVFFDSTIILRASSGQGMQQVLA